jgi:uncharacterized protein YqeY
MLRASLQETMKTAMREKDAATLGAVRLILAALKDKDIAARPSGNADGISEPEILSMMQGMIKQRRESVTMFRQGNREELAAKEEAEIAVIERFLPKQMNDAETAAAVDAVVTETGAASIKDMGKVMAGLKARFAGQMDFAKAGPAVKARLGG